MISPSNFTQWVHRYSGLILLFFPIFLVEIIGSFLVVGADELIVQYLLQAKALPISIGFAVFFESGFILISIWYLYPVIQFQKEYFQKVYSNQFSKTDALTDERLQKVQSRIYNFPLFLIPIIYSIWFCEIGFQFFMNIDQPFFVIFVAGLIANILTAVITYYTVDMIIRFLLIPYWFPTGEIKVKHWIKKPNLYQRFLDLFLINAFLPTVSILGVLYLAFTQSSDHGNILERVLISTFILTLAFWGFGFPFMIISATTIIKPINQLNDVANKIGVEDYNFKLPVYSDDQLGNLQQTMNRIARELEEKSLIKTLFGHYVSPVVRDMIINGKINTNGEKLEAVILFTDIRSFTTITESIPPEKVVNLLNIHFSRMVTAISDNQGFVDKFIGDAMMAVFDSELCEQNHRLFAFHAIQQILEGMNATNNQMREMGLPEIKIGLGISCGDVIRGNIGSPDRKELTVIGDPVNIASRLESMTKEIGHTVVATRNSFDLDLHSIPGLDIFESNPIRVKGKAELVDIVAFSLIA